MSRWKGTWLTSTPSRTTSPRPAGSWMTCKRRPGRGTSRPSRSRSSTSAFAGTTRVSSGSSGPTGSAPTCWSIWTTTRNWIPFAATGASATCFGASAFPGDAGGPGLFREDLVRPPDEAHEDLGIGEAGVLGRQVGLEDPTGPGTSPSNMDADAVPDRGAKRVGQRRPPHRPHGVRDRGPPQRNRLTEQEDLDVLAGRGERVGMEECKSGLGGVVGSPRALHEDPVVPGPGPPSGHADLGVRRVLSHDRSR